MRICCCRWGTFHPKLVIVGQTMRQFCGLLDCLRSTKSIICCQDFSSVAWQISSLRWRGVINVRLGARVRSILYYLIFKCIYIYIHKCFFQLHRRARLFGGTRRTRFLSSEAQIPQLPRPRTPPQIRLHQIPWLLARYPHYLLPAPTRQLLAFSFLRTCMERRAA